MTYELNFCGQKEPYYISLLAFDTEDLWKIFDDYCDVVECIRPMRDSTKNLNKANWFYTMDGFYDYANKLRKKASKNKKDEV